MACITVDTYRGFEDLARSGHGSKNLKAIMIRGDSSFPLPKAKDYIKYSMKSIRLDRHHMMSKYHNLGTPINVAVLK